jgi:hypothetical protein
MGKHISKNMGRDTVERFLIDRERQYTRENNEEAAVYCKIIRKAWEEAFYRPTDGNKKNRNIIRREARAFLTKLPTEPDMLCWDGCDIHPDWMRRKALDAIKNGPPQPYPPGSHLEEITNMRKWITDHFTIRRLERETKLTGQEAYDSIPEGI